MNIALLFLIAILKRNLFCLEVSVKMNLMLMHEVEYD